MPIPMQEPKIDFAPTGLMGGMLYDQRRRQYDKLMEQEMFLRDLANKEKQYDFGEKQEGRGFRDLKRDVGTETLLGQLPHARETASQELLTKGATAEGTRQNLPGKLAAERADNESKVMTHELEKGLRGAQLLSQTLNEVIEIQKTNPQLAMEVMKQKAAALERAGFPVPPYVMNPQSWGPINNALVNSVQQQQAIEQQKAREAAISARRERIANAPPKPALGTTARMNQLARMLLDDNLPEQQRQLITEELRGLAAREWQKVAGSRRFQELHDILGMLDKNPNNEKLRKRADYLLGVFEKEKADFYRSLNLNLDEEGVTNQEAPSTSKPTQPQSTEKDPFNLGL